MNLAKTMGQLETSAQLQAVFDKDDLEDLPVIFDFFDTERTGSVHGANVERMLFLLGYIVEQDTIKKSRLYTLDDFLNLAGRCSTKDDVRNVEQKVAKKCFQMIDISCHGTVDPQDMHRFLNSCGVRCSYEKSVQLVSAVDRTDDDADCFGVDDLHHFLAKFGTVQEEDAFGDFLVSEKEKYKREHHGGDDAGEGEEKGAEGADGSGAADDDGGAGEGGAGGGGGGGDGSGEVEAEAEEASDSSSDDEE